VLFADASSCRSIDIQVGAVAEFQVSVLLVDDACWDCSDPDAAIGPAGSEVDCTEAPNAVTTLPPVGLDRVIVCAAAIVANDREQSRAWSERMGMETACCRCGAAQSLGGAATIGCIGGMRIATERQPFEP
jgi:hypothetical protein